MFKVLDDYAKATRVLYRSTKKSEMEHTTREKTRQVRNQAYKRTETVLDGKFTGEVWRKAVEGYT